MTTNYGKPPQKAGRFDHVACDEMMCFLYLPIRMKGGDDVRVPEPLKIFGDLIRRVCLWEPRGTYLYLTAKHLYVTPQNPGNRPGWHADGFGTDDVNYIWYDALPTIFCVQDFHVSPDHERSMRQFEEQARPENFVQYPPKTLLRLTQENIHRTPIFERGQMRTFVKITSSLERYNLKGNAHNHLFDYDWKMYDREEVRNHPIHSEADVVRETV